MVNLILQDGSCYGTNDFHIFNGGPASDGECDASGLGSDKSIDTYIFPKCEGKVSELYLNDEDMCISDSITEQTLKDAKESCNSQSSSIATFSEFKQIVRSSRASVEYNQYWLGEVDREGNSQCANYTPDKIGKYNCPADDSETHLYYCKLPQSPPIMWMQWISWSKCDCSANLPLRQRERYKLSLDPDNRVDVESANCSCETNTSTSALSSTVSSSILLSSTENMGIEEFATTMSSTISATTTMTSTTAATTTTTSTTAGTTTTTSTTAAAATPATTTMRSTTAAATTTAGATATTSTTAETTDVTNTISTTSPPHFDDSTRISAGMAISSMKDLQNHGNSSLNRKELEVSADVFSHISQKLSISSPDDAKSVIKILSETVDIMISDGQTSGLKDDQFISVIESVEAIASKSARLLTEDYTRNLTNIYITTKSLQDPIYKSTGFHLYIEGVRVNVSLTDSVILTELDSGTTQLVALAYKDLGGMFGQPATNIRTNEDEQHNSILKLSNIVVSLTFSTTNHSHRLAEDISIQIPVDFNKGPGVNNSLLNSDIDVNISATCVFWSRQSEKWLTDGCITIPAADHVTCRCNHLTSFAVLMQYTDYKAEEGSVEHHALTLIGQIGCAVSLACLVVTFSVFVYLDNLRSERKYIHMNLAVALGLAQITHMVGIDMTYDRISCKAIAVLLHLFYMSTFTWMLCEGIQLYVKIVTVFNTENKFKQYMYYIIGWVIPVVIVGISMAVKLDGYGTQSFCWLSTEDGLIWAFIGPVCLVVLINLCIMLVVIKIIVSAATAMSMVEHHQTTITAVKAGVKGVAILTPILGINWVFGLLAVNKNMVVFEFLFVILNSLQGLFIFLLHCVGSSEVRAAFRSKIYISSKSKYFNASSSKHANTLSYDKDYSPGIQRAFDSGEPSSDHALLNENEGDTQPKDISSPISAQRNRRFRGPKKQASTTTVVTCLEYGRDMELS